MTGYQDFVELFGSGRFVSSKDIKQQYPFEKALSSLYIIPTFFKGIYYVPTSRERKGHFIENKQDFFISLFDLVYGRKRWYWALTTAARFYGFEWSTTRVLEIMTLAKSKTVSIVDRASSLQQKRSYRSITLAEYLDSLQVNIIYIHKGSKERFNSVRIDGELGPICSKDQLFEDLKQYRSKVNESNLKKVYDRILKEY
jgi:hypothetical protein